MECSFTFALCSGIVFTISFLVLTISLRRFPLKRNQLPPGPRGWPLFGNMFDLGALPHRSMAELSKKYGPVMWLRLGSVNTMVVSSAEAAMEMFKNHDISFAGRTSTVALRVHHFNQSSMTMAQYGPYWRLLRRIYTTELFTTSRINGTQSLRARCMDYVTRWIHDEYHLNGGSVEIGRFVALVGLNIFGNVVLSKECVVDPNSKQGEQFLASFEEALKLVAAPNVADFFPFLRWLDPQRIKANAYQSIGQTLNFASGFVKERLADRQNGLVKTKKDFLDVILDYHDQGADQKGTEITEENVNVMIMELLLASTDSTTSTIEWALVELLRHPNIMKDLQDELTRVVGPGKKVDEDDIGKLELLQAVVKETLRLHPTVPVLVPRRAMEDTEFMGYLIPRDTQVFVNIWAIGKDPVSWRDPLSFKPERFLGSTIDYRGQHFQFLPFGAGRRMCVAILLAHRMLHLGLGSLIHSFDWGLEDGTMPDDMDMGERLGFTLRKKVPLKVVLKPRTYRQDSNGRGDEI
ncbi:hypothetical protein ACHQM5_003225 [Ranunculus cassubicifolius]